MVEASTPMRSPLTRPCSARRRSTQATRPPRRCRDGRSRRGRATRSGAARPRSAAAPWAPIAGAGPASARACARRTPTPRPAARAPPRGPCPLGRPAFFVRRLLLGARRLGVPRPGPLGAVAEFLEVVPAALRPDLAAEPGRHPRRHLRPRPQPAVGGRLGQARPAAPPRPRPPAAAWRPRSRAAGRPGRPAHPRRSGGGARPPRAPPPPGPPPPPPPPPAPPVAGDLRHLPLAPAPAQEPDDLEVRPFYRRPGRPVTLAQLRGAQVSRQTRC